MESLNSREQWLAALDMKPIDRLPFWPKLDQAYIAGQGPDGEGQTPMALHEDIGSDPPIPLWPNLAEKSNACREQSDARDGGWVRTIETPLGPLRSRSWHDPVSQAPHPVEYPVKTIDDIHKMTAYYRDRTVEPKNPRSNSAVQPPERVQFTSLNASPLMHWIQELAGPEQGHFLLMTAPDDMAELFDAMHRLNLRRIDIILSTMAPDFILQVENTSTTLISPDQYRRLNLPHIREYAHIARQAGRRLVLHMCGHLKAILPDLETLPVSGFEAFTSPTVGNTTLRDGRLACPTKCLIGGTNAALWMRPESEIIAELDRHLAELPHHRGLVLSSGGMMPPHCRLQTIRRVAQWIRGYPIRLQ